MFLLTERLARAVPPGVSDDAIAVVDAFAVGEFYVRSANVQPDEIPIVLGAGADRPVGGGGVGFPGRRADHRVGLQ